MFHLSVLLGPEIGCRTGGIMRRLIFVQPYYYSNSYKYENAKKKCGGGGGVNLTVPQTIDTRIINCEVIHITKDINRNQTIMIAL